MELFVLLALLLAQTPSYAFTNDRRSIALPATFLKPPPPLSHYKFSNVHPYVRRMPLINTLDRPHNEKGLLQPNDYWQQSKLAARTPPADYNYFHNLACNPCNRVPWIPVLGYAYPTNVPQQPSHSVNIPPNPYYDELANNIVKPINAVPWYVMPVPTPTYQPYVSNHLWLQSAIQQSPEVHASQQSALQPQPVPVPVPAHPLPAPSTVSPLASNVDDLAMSHWISDAQPAHLFHYEHQIEYPNPYEQAPALDLPHQIPQSSLPVPQIPYSMMTGLGRYSNFNYTDSVDITSNHLDDSKYSSSENKFSFTSNVTENGGGGSGGGDDGSGRAQRGGNETLLKDYLTPPPSLLGLEGWLASTLDNEQISSQVEVRPLAVPDPARPPPPPPPSYELQETTVEVKPHSPRKPETEPKSEKKKKQIQIIIPYTINKSKHVAKNLRDDAVATKTNFVLRAPVLEFGGVSSTTTLPLIKYLKENTTSRPTKSTGEGTDWQKLRKAIDSWTEERFSNPKYNASAYFSSISRGTSTLPPSKVIPKAFLKSAIVHRDDNDLGGGGGGGANVIQNRVSSGIKDTSNKKQTTTESSLSSIWKSVVSLTESPYTKEKVFIVTPLPMTNYTYGSSNVTADNWNYL